MAAVGVLVFVDEDVIEAASFGAADGGEFRQQFFGVEEEIVEVDGADTLEVVLIATIGGGGEDVAFAVS